MPDIVILDDNQDISAQLPEDKKPKVELWEQKPLMDRINDYIVANQSLWVKEKVVFYRLLATMVNAWISLLKSMTILEKQETNPVLKNILSRFKEEIRDWKGFSECLWFFPASFANAEIWIIESWEKTWKLNDALQTLATQVEKVASMSWKIKSALMYPGMIILVVFWVMGVMMTMVVPKLLNIFGYEADLPLDHPTNIDAMSKLPTSTKILIGISNFFTNYWWLMIISFFGSVFFISIWKKTPEGMYKFDKIMLKLPIFWELSKKVILSKFARVLSWLMSSWVSIVESLRITAESSWNEVYRQRIMLLRNDIKQWLKMWESLDGDPLFPDMMVQMIQVWEQTAQVDKIIIKVADFYDEQVDNTVGMINKLLEPFIIVFMAVMVWFIAVGIMEPIMNLADQVAKW